MKPSPRWLVTSKRQLILRYIEIHCLLKPVVSSSIKDKFVLKSDLLYRQLTSWLQDQLTYHIVLPKKYWQQALTGCHDNVGHFGIKRTSCLIKDWIYWPHLSCLRCQRFKSRLDKAKMSPIVTTHLLTHVDFLTIEALNLDNDVSIRVVMDHFTWFAQAFVTPLLVSSLVAKTLWDKFFIICGSLRGFYVIKDVILGNPIQELCIIAQIKKLITTPYKPQTNGQCKWFNGPLISMIGTLDPKVKQHWPEEITYLTHAYNCIRNNASSYSPYFLMFGHKPLLSIDIKFGVHTPNIFNVSSMKYVAKCSETDELDFLTR